MATLKILKFGDPSLRKVCRPVDEITPRIVTLIDDMIETMRAADGCGLAAPQVGILRRIAVIEVEEGKVYDTGSYFIDRTADLTKRGIAEFKYF